MTRDELNNFIVQAEHGDIEAQFTIGEYYYQSTNDEESSEDYEYACKEAAKWFLLAAKQGHDFSMYEIAICYRDGIGVEKNEIEAEKWHDRFGEAKKEWESM